MCDRWGSAHTDMGRVCPAVFTNRLEDMRLQDLAEMDVKLLVQEVRLIQSAEAVPLKSRNKYYTHGGQEACRLCGLYQRPRHAKKPGRFGFSAILGQVLNRIPGG